MDTEIIKTRRANLRRWVDQHGIPQDEKSYFSQLLNSGSFGERAARRLEQAYRMGEHYLDRPLEGISSASASTPMRRMLPAGGSVLMRVDEEELHLMTLYREADERGKKAIMDQAEVAEKVLVLGLRGHKTK
jgi:hypothetical protein